MIGKESFADKVDFKTGELANCGSHNKVYLNDIKTLFKDQEEVQKRLDENPLIYETFYPDIDTNIMYVFYGVTKIHPGTIGREFFMTKGHLHIPEQITEMYLCLSGRGMLLEQKDNNIKKTVMEPGTITYVGESSFHRTYNIGKEPFIFIVACNADFEHDYSLLKDDGFLEIVTVDDL